MHEVTRREGIYSAMAIPVLDDNAVAAILYVANHAPLAYLQDFAEAINLSLQATMSREELLEAGRQAERQALGRHLHDRLGRHVSQLSRLVAAQPDHPAGGALAEVSAVVAELARSLREDIDSLMGGAEPPLLSPAEVAAEICRVPSIAGLRRIVQVRGRPGESEYDPVLPANVSEALRRVGQEAVFKRGTAQQRHLMHRHPAVRGRQVVADHSRRRQRLRREGTRDRPLRPAIDAPGGAGRRGQSGDPR